MSYYIVNAVTLYRLLAAPVLLILIFSGKAEMFSWLLPVSFFTDAIDGWLARRSKVATSSGAKLDSVADDLTIVVSLVGMAIFKATFFLQQLPIVLGLLALFIVQVMAALIRYGQMSSFHTYAAKLAAVLQGAFFILLFLVPQPLLFLFYLAAVVTALELIEEIILVAVMPRWQTDIKGLYWLMRSSTKKKNHTI